MLEGLRGEESISSICRREGINPKLYYRWSKEFLEAGKKRLLGDTQREATSFEVTDLRKKNGQGFILTPLSFIPSFAFGGTSIFPEDHLNQSLDIYWFCKEFIDTGLTGYLEYVFIRETGHGDYLYLSPFVT